MANSFNSLPSYVPLETVPHQIGTAVLNVGDGSLARECTGNLTYQDAKVLHTMILECGTLLRKPTSGLDDDPAPSYVDAPTIVSRQRNAEGLKRITITFPRTKYTAALGSDGLLYIVKMDVTSNV